MCILALCSEENILINKVVLRRYCRLLQGHSVVSNICISRISGFRPKANGGESKIISFSLQAMLWFSSFQRCLGSVVNSHLCGSSRRSSVDSCSFVTAVCRLCLRLASSVLAGKTRTEPCRCIKHIKTGCHERQVTFQNATRQKSEQPLLMMSSNWPVPIPSSSRLTLSR